MTKSKFDVMHSLFYLSRRLSHQYQTYEYQMENCKRNTNFASTHANAARFRLDIYNIKNMRQQYADIYQQSGKSFA